MTTKTPEQIEAARRDAIQGAIDGISAFFLDHCPGTDHWESFDGDLDGLRAQLQEALDGKTKPVRTGFDTYIELRSKDAPHVARRLTAEKRMAEALVRRCLKDGYTVSVYDGEDWPIKHSSDLEAIMMALASTDEDTITIHDASNKKLGWFYLVYGNDGWDVVSDYSANVICEDIFQTTISPLADKIEAGG